MKINPFYFLYQYLIAWPVILVLTVLTAVSTIILAPLFPNSPVSHFPARWWSRLICYLLFIRVEVTGLEKLKVTDSYIIAANHQSIFDIFAMYGWLPNIFKWIMKAELRKIPLVGKACESAGHVFIDRSNPIAAQKSLKRAEKQLINGVSVVIFPEGTRTKDGLMSKFKKGAFRIATDLLLPIVPVTIRGSFERLPRNTVYVSPGIIEMIFHDPIDVKLYDAEQTPQLMQDTWHVINNDLQ
ncbi:1-acyl-sn-glycerol-3-phosphate acyltransferase [bioreactor metagenome]|jgi:1-acyl-sn-glycerol-3-phosphate acyltransferase|uniref:1-acyl-sn-glycerol-3-phosphate acyltransferase n=1 Tax=bioreactor metagenome TaxID=1076179 RepID=A0A644WC54_9ZZZZ|nr:lysophospholipid acyltransferase family protein [Paludibacter sp.]